MPCWTLLTVECKIIIKKLQCFWNFSIKKATKINRQTSKIIFAPLTWIFTGIYYIPWVIYRYRMYRESVLWQCYTYIHTECMLLVGVVIKINTRSAILLSPVPTFSTESFFLPHSRQAGVVARARQGFFPTPVKCYHARKGGGSLRWWGFRRVCQKKRERHDLPERARRKCDKKRTETTKQGNKRTQCELGKQRWT